MVELVAFLLVRPRTVGYALDLPTRVAIYRMIDPSLQRAMYDSITPELRIQCAAERLDFDKLFPEPDGMAELRKERGAVLK